MHNEDLFNLFIKALCVFTYYLYGNNSFLTIYSKEYFSYIFSARYKKYIKIKYIHKK